MQILRPAVQVTKLNTKIPPSFQLQIYGDSKQEFLLISFYVVAQENVLFRFYPG